MTAIQNVFKRTDPQVQEDALGLDIDAFKRKYVSQAKETVLTATWKDARKKQQQANKTDEANDLPEVAAVKTVKTTLSDGSELTNKTLTNGTQVASVDSEPNADTTQAKKGTKKKEKVPPAEKAAPAPAATPAATAEGDKPARATRLRALIAEGKNKADATAVLKTEGYDVKTIHSEWNRLNKKA